MKITEKTMNNIPNINKRIAKLEDRLMEKLFDDNIIDTIIDFRHIDTMHDPSNNSDTTLLDRAINTTEKTKEASVFDSEKREIIQNALMDRVSEIIPWLIKPGNKTLTITIDEESKVGHGIAYRNNKPKEYATQDITLVLTKDDNTDTGFRCKTAYPDISVKSTTRTSTGRNLIPDLIQTRTFKKADTNTKTKLIQAAINGLDRRLSPIEHIYANIVAQPAFTNDMQIAIDNDQITIRHPNADNYSTLHISAKETYTTNGCTPELARLKTFIENKFKIQSKESTNTTRKDKKPLTRSESAQNEERINNEVRKELFGNQFDNQKDDTQLQ